MQIQPDASAISKSTAESISGKSKNLIEGTTGFIDSFFPLIDQKRQHTNTPLFVLWVMTLYQLLQFVALPFFCIYQSNAKSSEKNLNYLNIIFSIFYFCPANATMTEFLTGFIVCFVLTAIVVAFIIFEQVYYKNNHRFMKWSLYVFSVLCEIIIPILITPSTFLFSNSVSELLHNSSSVLFWVFTVLSLVMLIFQYVILYITYNLSCSSAYLRKTPIATFESFHYIIMLGYNSISIFAILFLQIYDPWVFTVFCVFQIVGAVAAIVMLFRLPFFNQWINSIFAGIYTMYVIGNILSSSIPKILANLFYVQAIIVVFVTIIAACVFYGIFYFCKKRILKYMRVAFQVDDEKTQRYIDSGLDVKEQSCLKYIEIGFMGGCPSFYDWSLVKFAFTNHQTTYVYCRLLQIISFFPSESRPMSYLFGVLTKRRDLNFGQRFLIYEVYRIKMTRQSSISADATERLSTLKSQTRELEAELRSFWPHETSPVAFAEGYAKRVESLRALWDEAVRDYPNNPKIAQEYSVFLAECATRLDAAVLQHQRSALIEGGHNFSTDIAFKQMVRMFPVYVKSSILDFKGNLIKKTFVGGSGSQVSQTSSSGNKSGSNNYSSESTITIDAEMEDMLSKQILKQGHLRMALHNSIEDRQTCSIANMFNATLVIAAVVIAIFVAVYVITEKEFQQTRESMGTLLAIANTRFFVDLSDLLVFLRALNTSNPRRLDNLEIIQKVRSEEAMKVTSYGDVLSDFVPQIMTYTNKAFYYLRSVMAELASLSKEGVDVYSLASTMMNDEVNVTFCVKEDPLEPGLTSLKNSITFIIYMQAILAGKNSGLEKMFEMVEMCEMYINHNTFAVETGNLFEMFYNDQVKNSANLQDIVFYMMLAATIATFLVVLVPELSFIIAFIREMQSALDALHSVNQDSKDAAMLPICKASSDDDCQPSEMSVGVTTWVGRIAVLVVLTLVITAAAFMMPYLAYMNAGVIATQNAWLLFASNRLAGCTAASIRTLQAVVTDGSIGVDYMVHAEVAKEAQDQLQILEENNGYLLLGKDGIEASFGYDDTFDEYNTKERCTFDGAKDTMHDVYKCASTNQQISVFKDMVTEIVNDPFKLGGKVNDELSLNMLHISVAHIWSQLVECMEYLVTMCENTYQEMIVYMAICLAIGIVATLCLLVFARSAVNEMKSSYKTILILIKRLPPTGIMQNKRLMAYILRKSTKASDASMSVAQSVIHNSASGIMCTGIGGVIEIINPAVSNILGFTPEQLLGQPVTAFCQQESAETLQKQMELMKAGQAATTFECHLALVDDASNEVSCSVVVLGMRSERDTKVASFVIIFEDESELLQRQREAEEAKAKSENLLYQILPRDIVVKLNAGEKDICFTVESATIIFIDIVKFSEYAANLTPQDIMGNLSLIFQSFDTICARFPLLTKIKLIGDVYMAAAGLFSKPEDDPKEHALQTVQFAIECLTALEDINVKLNASLHVRIGINTGGPLLAGVLGTDKPVFDIIGDPINVAARLQSTDIPGRIQVSGRTQELVQDCGLDIEQRGEIYLKGKGNQMTYFVQPVNDFMAQLSSHDMIAH